MEEIVNIAATDADRGHLKRRLLRIVLPIACVALLMATIVGIALLNYTSNRKDALALSQDLLRSLDRQIASEVGAYLSPATDMVNIFDRTLNHPAYASGRYALGEPLAMQILVALPQLTIFSFADTDGNYLMVKKMPDGSIHTKRIDRDGASLKAAWTRRDPEGHEIAKEIIDDETFDPRVRPWYIGAVESSGVYWTDVYIFFTDQKPGITASKAFHDADGRLLGVVGVDIALENLSNFLGALRVGDSGQAMIIDADGRLVAFPEVRRMLARKDESFVVLHLNELDDPVLDQAFNRFLIEKEGHRELLVDGKKYINTVSSLRSTVAKDWSVLIVVPADDFVGFVSSNYQNALLMSLAVLGLASLLAGLLIWQGLRADRNARILLSRRKEMEAQSQAFSDLAAKPAIFDSTDAEALEAVTRITAQATNTRRVSVWQWHDDHRRLTCIDCYDRESDGHTQGTRLTEDDLPQLFAALVETDHLAVMDTMHDPRTAELHRVYLDPLGCNGFLSTSIVDEDRRRGVLWLEQERIEHGWRPEIIAFAKAVAGLLALRLRGMLDQTVCEPDLEPVTASVQPLPADGQAPMDAAVEKIKPLDHAAADMRQATIVDTRAQAFREQIQAHGTSPEAIGADIFEDATVLVLQFNDPIAMAAQLEDENPTTVVDRLIGHLEKLASQSGVEYMKYMGDQLICAAGLGDDGILDHTRLIATLALDVRDVCLHLFINSENSFDFRIGIDSGAVIGSMVGREHKTYNLWGAAVQTATKMAQSGQRGKIHVTESVYRRLERRFLFNVRGRYYLPTIGELSTYMLTGHL